MIKTTYWIVDNEADYPQLMTAALLIRQGETVAFPTETVYGLGANALSTEAVDKIFEAKGRPSDNPLIIHIASIKQLDQIVSSLPAVAEKLMQQFWPGPLTLVLPKQPHVPTNVTGGLSTVAVRMPSHPIALALIEAADLPIAAPSANLSGKPSPTSAAHVREDLDGRVAGIIDGGPSGVGVESTVVDCTGEIPIILRPGGITKEMLENVIGEVIVDQALVAADIVPKSPGMKYKHYAPDAPLTLVEGTPRFLQTLADELMASGKRVGILTTAEHLHVYHADVVLPCGSRQNVEASLQNLYSALRTFNQTDLDMILSETFSRQGIGEALMNRLLKAANNQVISE